QQINPNQDMDSNQDKPRNSPYKDVHAGNLEDEEQNNSIENRTLQLVSAEKPFSTSSISKNHELMHGFRKTF
ncbi:zinc finger protein 583, partial [Biomphalaria pfeifferi]